MVGKNSPQGKKVKIRCQLLSAHSGDIISEQLYEVVETIIFILNMKNWMFRDVN